MNIVANFADPAPRRMILDVPVCDFGWEEALRSVNELTLRPSGQTVISFVNAHNLLIQQRDANYREILTRNLVLPDGIGVDIASRVAHGVSFPANLNGTDFVPAFLTYMDQPMRVGLIGGTSAVVERAAENFLRHAPWHEFIVISDGYLGQGQSGAVAEEALRQELDVLIVGMGTPLQEKWVAAHIRPEHARLVLTVGALFDFVSERVPRAPRLVRVLRLEWVFRMVQEPRRLWRRYLLGVPLFFHQVARYRLRGGASRPRQMR